MREMIEIEAGIAKAAGELVQTILQVAKSQTPAATDFIDALRAATLAVNVTGTQVELELRTRAENADVVLYSAIFEECGVLQ